MLGPPEEPAYSNAYAIMAGKKKAQPVPQSRPARINIQRLVETEIRSIAAIDTRMKVMIIRCLLCLSRIRDAKALPIKIMAAIEVKKYPGLFISMRTAYNGTKASVAPHIKLNRKEVMAGRIILRSRIGSFDALLCRSFRMYGPGSLQEKNNAQSERPAQVRKRVVKL